MAECDICEGEETCQDAFHEENTITNDLHGVRCPHCGGTPYTRYDCPEYERAGGEPRKED
jgi:hypothetical protein